MNQNFKQTANAKCSETMETRDHFKNGASSKSHTSRIIFNRVAMTVIALCVVFSVSAQSKFEQRRLEFLSQYVEVGDPDSEIIMDKKGILYQGDKKMDRPHVKQALVGNSVALQQYNSGVVLDIVGNLVVIPAALALGYGTGMLIFFPKNEETKKGVYLGSGILIGIGAAGWATGYLISHLGGKKIENAINLHNSGLKRDVSYQIDFGITPTGGVGLTLRF